MSSKTKMTKRVLEDQSLSLKDIIKSGDCEEVEMYINRMVTKKGSRADLRTQNVLICAFNLGKFDIALRILEIADVDLKIQDVFGKTALHYACSCDKMDIVEKIVGLDPDVIDIEDNSSRIPAHFALRNDNAEMFQFLAESGNTYLDKYNFLEAAYRSHSLSVFIYLLYIKKIRKFDEKVLWEGYDYHNPFHLEKFFACFKIMYNYLHPENEWRIGYQLRDMFRVEGFMIPRESYFAKCRVSFQTILIHMIKKSLLT